MEYKLRLYPDQILYQKSKSVTPDQMPYAKELSEAMLKIMHEAHGLGLSAIQIGVPLRIMVMTKSTSTPWVLINPKIIKEKKSRTGVEGCLSFPGIVAQIKRHELITVSYLNLDGEVCEEKFGGYYARCVAHELDHFEGEVFINLIPERAKFLLKKPLQELQRKFEENKA